MRQRTLLTTAVTLIIIGVVGVIVVGLLSANNSAGNSAAGGGETSPSDAAIIGRSIYLTGVGSEGTVIPRSATTMRGMMARQGCATCHGDDGRGGTITVPGSDSIEAPDIRYSALRDEGFTDDSIARAIREGVDERGDDLDLMMPRWDMSDTDMKYLIEYLKELSD